ncbi:MAG TPA: sigma 54-interacting transcriptional regulator [Kofleriaceae bacterium]|nr:sigma 54-interacting transcriptional regulator [Kofleriaceae bacterium]
MRSADEPVPAPAPPAWTLVLAHHPDPALIGRWTPIGAGLELGRGGDAFGDGALDHATLSRTHARITSDPRVQDLGSRNGTRVNGAPASGEPLAPGDVIEIGDLLLLAVRPARPPRVIDDAGVIGRSGALAEVIDELRASRASTVLLVGETGTGKSLLARAMHAWSGRGAIAILPCASVSAELAARELHGVTAGAFPGAVERAGLLAGADGGTLVLDGLDDAAPPVQAALRAFLDDRTLRPVGGAAPRVLDVRVIATARGTGLVRPELASRVEAFVVRVPPLRDRLEDLPVLARAAFARAGRAPSKRLALALYRHAWPHNARELEGVIERAIASTPDDPVPLSPAIAAHLGAADPAPTAALIAAADGSWMRVHGGERINLRRRESLGRLLQALIAARRDRPGQPLSIKDLFDAGWPDEKAAARSAAGRVYVALTALRNLGLRDLLRRDDDGYAIDPDARVEIVD